MIVCTFSSGSNGCCTCVPGHCDRVFAGPRETFRRKRHRRITCSVPCLSIRSSARSCSRPGDFPGGIRLDFRGRLDRGGQPPRPDSPKTGVCLSNLEIATEETSAERETGPGDCPAFPRRGQPPCRAARPRKMGLSPWHRRPTSRIERYTPQNRGTHPFPGRHSSRAVLRPMNELGLRDNRTAGPRMPPNRRRGIRHVLQDGTEREAR